LVLGASSIGRAVLTYEKYAARRSPRFPAQPLKIEIELLFLMVRIISILQKTLF
jgi:hypothetical protein